MNKEIYTKVETDMKEQIEQKQKEMDEMAEQAMEEINDKETKIENLQEKITRLKTKMRQAKIEYSSDDEAAPVTPQS